MPVTRSRTRRVSFLLAASSSFLIAGCASAPSRPVEKADCRSVYIFWPSLSGNHTSLLIPQEDFPVPEAVVEGSKDPRTDLIEVGFGSQEYFAERRRGRWMPTWRLLVPTPGVLMVQPFPWGGKPEDWKTSVPGYVRLDLAEADYRRLLDYIKSSFARDPKGALKLEASHEGMGLYRSVFDYSFRRVCHTWALDALKTAGVTVARGWPYRQGLLQDAFSTDYRRPDSCR